MRVTELIRLKQFEAAHGFGRVNVVNMVYCLSKLATIDGLIKIDSVPGG